MSFKKPVLPVVEPKEGYDRLDASYKQYHTHLNSFDRGIFLRMLPRSLDGADVLELGAGDGRIYSYLKDNLFHSYVANDISSKLLSRHPGGKVVQKLVFDIEETFPLQDESFDLVLSFFVFEHVDDIRSLFEEVNRVLRPGGSWVVGHFLHRREFVFKDDIGSFKIRHVKRSFDQLEEMAEWCFLDHTYIDVIEKGATIGRIYKFEKI